MWFEGTEMVFWGYWMLGLRFSLSPKLETIILSLSQSLEIKIRPFWDWQYSSRGLGLNIGTVINEVSVWILRLMKNKSLSQSRKSKPYLTTPSASQGNLESHKEYEEMHIWKRKDLVSVQYCVYLKPFSILEHFLFCIKFLYSLYELFKRFFPR